MDIEKQTSFLIGLFILINSFLLYDDWSRRQRPSIKSLARYLISLIVTTYLLFARSHVSGTPTYILTSVVLFLICFFFMLFTFLSDFNSEKNNAKKIIIETCLFLLSVYSGYLGYRRFSISI